MKIYFFSIFDNRYIKNRLRETISKTLDKWQWWSLLNEYKTTDEDENRRFDQLFDSIVMRSFNISRKFFIWINHLSFLFNGKWMRWQNKYWHVTKIKVIVDQTDEWSGDYIPLFSFSIWDHHLMEFSHDIMIDFLHITSLIYMQVDFYQHDCSE